MTYRMSRRYSTAERDAYVAALCESCGGSDVHPDWREDSDADRHAGGERWWVFGEEICESCDAIRYPA
jgi:hypothetical protein